MVKKGKTLQDSLIKKELGKKSVEHTTTEEEHLALFIERFDLMEK